MFLMRAALRLMKIVGKFACLGGLLSAGVYVLLESSFSVCVVDAITLFGRAVMLTENWR